jgi:hypothetical protein
MLLESPQPGKASEQISFAQPSYILTSLLEEQQTSDACGF